MRHGQSRANASGTIVSSIERDQSGDFGLTGLGRDQAAAAARRCGLPASTVTCCSDFARARQTAQIAVAGLGAAPAVIMPALRERYFGDLDGGPVSGYERVWAADAVDGTRSVDGAESAAAVLARMTALVARLEEQYPGAVILLVSHGDPLQILQAGLSGLGPARHREVPHLEVAEIRPLTWAA
jgi:probable phosphoglycerate mutase